LFYHRAVVYVDGGENYSLKEIKSESTPPTARHKILAAYVHAICAREKVPIPELWLSQIGLLARPVGIGHD